LALAQQEEYEKLWNDLRQPQAADVKVPLEHQLRQGDPANEILRVAQEIPCDIIVLGMHGRTGLGRLLMGSVAEQVVRRAPCPVLTVKAPFPEPVTAPEAQAPGR
jgi:nucleotide-binding universal stress UspA family protein